MKPLSSEWVEIAEGDFATASREMRVRKSPNYDADMASDTRGQEGERLQRKA